MTTEEVAKNIIQVLAQFKQEEMGNKITQFNFLALENIIKEQLGHLSQRDKTDPQVTNPQQIEGDSKDE